MNKRQKQFTDLTLKFQEDVYNNVDGDMKQVYKEQKKDLNDTLNKIARIILSYTVIDNVLDLKMFEKGKLKNSFNKDINKVVKSQYDYEEATIDDILTKSATDKYYTDGYILSIGIDFNLKKLTEKQIKQVVNSKIDGKVWSDRLWTNKKKLERDLKREINNLLNGKTDINKIEKLIKNKFNQNAYNSKRLINTEVAKCQSQVNDIFAEEHGITKQMFIATLDNRTSEICQSYDSKVFDIDDVDKPIPPLHPSCRSCLVNMPSNEWRPTIRKDNITKEYGNWESYQDWKEEQTS